MKTWLFLCADLCTVSQWVAGTVKVAQIAAVSQSSSSIEVLFLFAL